MNNPDYSGINVLSMKVKISLQKIARNDLKKATGISSDPSIYVIQTWSERGNHISARRVRLINKEVNQFIFCTDLDLTDQVKYLAIYSNYQMDNVTLQIKNKLDEMIQPESYVVEIFSKLPYVATIIL